MSRRTCGRLGDRRRGLPGRTLRAVLRRDDAAVELTLRSSRLRSLPLALLDPLLRAACTVAARAASVVGKVIHESPEIAGIPGQTRPACVRK